MREITQQQFDALEAEHGAGNVLVLTVADVADFSFRRYTEKDVDQILQWQDDGRTDFLILGARELTLLCPTAPRAGKGIAKDSKLPPDDRQAMSAERAQLASALQGAQGDIITLHLARLCGYGWKFEQDKDDPELIVITACYDAGTAYSTDQWVLKARQLTSDEYSEYRRLTMKGDPGSEDRYAWKACLSGEDKEQLAQRFAFLPIAGGQAAASLGANKGVTLKKFAPPSQAQKA